MGDHGGTSKAARSFQRSSSGSRAGAGPAGRHPGVSAPATPIHGGSRLMATPSRVPNTPVGGSRMGRVPGGSRTTPVTPVTPVGGGHQRRSGRGSLASMGSSSSGEKIPLYRLASGFKLRLCLISFLFTFKCKMTQNERLIFLLLLFSDHCQETLRFLPEPGRSLPTPAAPPCFIGVRP